MKKILAILALLGVVVALVKPVLERSQMLSQIINTTDPPPVYVVKNMEEQIECAKKAGFVIKKPILRIMRLPYVPASPHGFAYIELNVITLVYFASYETLAHELGHITNHQMGRNGMDQALADAVKGAILKECQSVK